MDEMDQAEPLPRLSGEPVAHPGCCLGLSETLLDHLHSILPPPPGRILSIGSGYGLLEALLLAPPFSLNVTGVEVYPSSNRFLPIDHHNVVSGTRFLDEEAGSYHAWLFVYPRRVGLITEYIHNYGKENENVKTIVWAGPQADWEDYSSCFGEQWQVKTFSAEEFGGRAWELLAIAKRVQAER
ncbi:hypothetical protein BS50DRAFT_573147 [Corynespora cassiicola Philippines]|uniref:Uncharacterized protein n=1 Tax=Corynespora cassiicola Philippines TaxID=1448308 RepID=A0A2T2NRX9_CORCC|nr:hypothetical protein BS50DRAFT_573147 [Corynespora cassiicola Philippines]